MIFHINPYQCAHLPIETYFQNSAIQYRSSTLYFWKTTDEAQLGTFSADNPALTLVGTIHTRPGFDSTPSSVDLHQAYDLQNVTKIPSTPSHLLE